VTKADLAQVLQRSGLTEDRIAQRRRISRDRCRWRRLAGTKPQAAQHFIASVSKTKSTVLLRERLYRVGAGGGTRTLKLSRAPAPKAGAFAISPRPQRADRTAQDAEEICRWSLGIPWTRPSQYVIAIYRKAAVARLDEFVGPKS
jgi:hypothetical protein